MTDTATIQVLGAIAYGEWKAYEGAKATSTDMSLSDEERAAYKKIAAEELRHHKGFARRLEAMGADLERAMAPYKGALDAFHSRDAHSKDAHSKGAHSKGADRDPIAEAMGGYLGEGIADDLLEWLKTVVDDETREFVESVIADEEEHEALATAKLRALIDAEPDGRARAGKAAREMIVHMLTSSGGGATQPLRFAAFLRMGRPHDLVWRIVSGYARRMRAVGLNPFGLPAFSLANGSA